MAGRPRRRRRSRPRRGHGGGAVAASAAAAARGRGLALAQGLGDGRRLLLEVLEPGPRTPPCGPGPRSGARRSGRSRPAPRSAAPRLGVPCRLEAGRARRPPRRAGPRPRRVTASSCLPRSPTSSRRRSVAAMASVWLTRRPPACTTAWRPGRRGCRIRGASTRSWPPPTGRCRRRWPAGPAPPWPRSGPAGLAQAGLGAPAAGPRGRPAWTGPRRAGAGRRRSGCRSRRPWRRGSSCGRSSASMSPSRRCSSAEAVSTCFLVASICWSTLPLSVRGLGRARRPRSRERSRAAPPARRRAATTRPLTPPRFTAGHPRPTRNSCNSQAAALHPHRLVPLMRLRRRGTG